MTCKRGSNLRRCNEKESGGGGQQLAFYSDVPSSNPAEVFSFFSVNCLKRTEINKKRPGLTHI